MCSAPEAPVADASIIERYVAKLIHFYIADTERNTPEGEWRNSHSLGLARLLITIIESDRAELEAKLLKAGHDELLIPAGVEAELKRPLENDNV